MIEARWISTKDNALADALSSFNHNRMANFASQLIFPTCSHWNHGFLTYRGQDSHQQQLTACGEIWPYQQDGFTTPQEHTCYFFALFIVTDARMQVAFQLNHLG